MPLNLNVRLLMQFRTANPSDAQAIAALHTQNWRQAYRTILSPAYLEGDLMSERLRLWNERFSASKTNQWILLAEECGELLGFTCAYGAEDVEHGTLLENLHVAQNARGSGLGAALVRAVFQWSNTGYPGLGIHLWALEQNSPARRFYERLGGVVTGSSNWSPPVGPSVAEVRYSWRFPCTLLPRAA